MPSFPQSLWFHRDVDIRLQNDVEHDEHLDTEGNGITEFPCINEYGDEEIDSMFESKEE